MLALNIEIQYAQQTHYKEIIEIWHAGWHEAHAKIVSDSIIKFRDRKHFWLWFETSSESDQFFVATVGDIVAGFVATNGPELVKLYVSSSARGTGAASALLKFGEKQILAQGKTNACLYCIAGNLPAQRFYLREGWSLCQTFADILWIPQTSTEKYFAETHRFEKRLV